MLTLMMLMVVIPYTKDLALLTPWQRKLHIVDERDVQLCGINLIIETSLGKITPAYVCH